MQFLDRASAAMLARTPRRRRVFRDGWGDAAVLAWYDGIVRRPPEIAALDLAAGPLRRVDGLVEQDLTFDSPAPYLPAASRLGRARMVSAGPDPERILLLMAAWSEHGYKARTALARLLAAEGIASLILENPLYGERRTDPRDDRPLATVADFAVMGRAAVIEGMALLGHYRRQGATIGVGGFSMGGNIAAFIGAMVPFPVAVAPAAGPHSPGPPFLQGVMRGAVDFEALGGDDPETEQRLRDFLFSATVLDHDPPPHASAAVMVAGTIDGFVPTAAVLALHRHWPGSHVEWVHAGHATLLWRHKDRMAQAAIDAFARLQALGGGA